MLQTAGGILLPETGKKLNEGEVRFDAVAVVTRCWFTSGHDFSANAISSSIFKSLLLCGLQVIAVGPGAVTRDGTKIPVNVAVGDRVLLPEYGGHTVKLGEDEYTLYRDEDILGKFQLK